MYPKLALLYFNLLIFIDFSGMIGRNWAMIFAGAGYRVCLYDVEPGQVSRALDATQHTLAGYQEKGLLRGQGSAVEQTERIKGTTNLQECISGAFYVQVNSFFNKVLHSTVLNYICYLYIIV
jgi:3-hydroxyacyl-CoA dehydrogenase